MRNLLYLVHRLPYPPNKGDKVRSYNILKHLTLSYKVFLGTFIDDREDFSHIEVLRNMCTELCVIDINPALTRIKSLQGLIFDRPLTLEYYRSRQLKRWVENVVSENSIDVAVVFSSSMAQYVEDFPEIDVLVDFVDMDSAKWSEYASQHKWPISWLYAREGKYLLSYERKVACYAKHSFFVTEKEVALFKKSAPESSLKIAAINNGVDADYFARNVECLSPFSTNEEILSLVFTGAMDYWPNIDAVLWFAQKVFPVLKNIYPNLYFYIVGRNPSQSVLDLHSKDVIVTGTVLDVRPYLQHASLVVAPLRIARGIQNKILEAMAMECAVVASASCVDAIDVVSGQEIMSADSSDDFIERIGFLLDAPQQAQSMGENARRRILTNYSWLSHLKKMDPYLDRVELKGAI